MKENVNKEVTTLLQQLIVEEFDGDSKIINQHIDQIISSLIQLLKDEDHMGTLIEGTSKVIADLTIIKTIFERKKEHGKYLLEVFEQDLLKACFSLSNAIYLLHYSKKLKPKKKLMESVYSIKNLHDTLMIAFQISRGKYYEKLV